MLPCCTSFPTVQQNNVAFRRGGKVEIPTMLLIQPSCPSNARFDGVTVGKTMLDVFTVAAHAMNVSLAATEARCESELMNAGPNLANRQGLIQSLRTCLNPIQAITCETISHNEGKRMISGQTEQWWLLDCSSGCSSDGKEKQVRILENKFINYKLKVKNPVWKRWF